MASSGRRLPKQRLDQRKSLQTVAGTNEDSSMVQKSKALRSLCTKTDRSQSKVPATSRSSSIAIMGIPVGPKAPVAVASVRRIDEEIIN